MVPGSQAEDGRQKEQEWTLRRQGCSSAHRVEQWTESGLIDDKGEPVDLHSMMLEML